MFVNSISLNLCFLSFCQILYIRVCFPLDIDIFVQNVKAICKAKGTNPTAACEASGAGRNFMDNIKKGSIPSVAKVQMLADYLGVTTSELLGEKVTPADHPVNGREEEFMHLFGQLTEDQQQLVLAQLKGIVDAKDK